MSFIGLSKTFFRLNYRIRDQAGGQSDSPLQQADWRGVEDCLQGRGVGEEELHGEHQRDSGKQPAVGQPTDAKDGAGERAAVEQVEELDQHDDVDRCRARRFQRGALRHFPMEDAEGAEQD